MPVTSRKRPAPGASPTVQNEMQSGMGYSTNPAQVANEQYLQWDSNLPNNNTSNYSDPSNNFSSNLYSTIPPQGRPRETSVQLARRPMAQQVMPRATYNGVGENWVGTMDIPQQQAVEDSWNNDDNELAQKAELAKKDATQKRKSIPPFVQKLSSFLDEDRNTDLIRWTSSGNSFVVLDEDEFARTLIPELFKHNNYASFVRQLNMYGFHKKVGLSDNSMRASERKNKSPSEYYNPYFKKGKPHLLWLIQKPKPAGKKRAEAQEDGNVDENGDEIFDVDVTTPMNQAPDDSGGGMRNTRAPLMIGPGGNGSGIPHEDLSAVHQELQQIRQQQQIISGVIKKIRRDHEQLYGQAAAFQELHSRHENSINAILTFLATVYNRSLEGHGAQNLANLFAGAIPHDAQHQGSVVDVGDVSTPDGSASNSQLRRPVRRAPLLLKAPPANSKDSGYGHSSDALRAESGAGLQQRPQTRSSLDTSQGNTYLQVDSPDARSGTVQEIFDQSGSNRSSESPQFSAKDGAQRQLTDHDILSFINSENANGTNFGENRMDFPEALSHLQTADGKSPLTTNQRNNVLQMIANGSAATSAGTNNNNNALTSPNAQVPDIPSWNATKEELDFLEKTLKEQDSKVANLSNMLQPLSPSGSIPGLTDSQTYGGNANSDPLDFDQLFNSGDYFNDNGANNDINFDGPPGDFNSAAEFDFGDPLGNGVTNGFDSDTQGEQGGRIVETVGSSEATTPANTAEDGAVYEAGRSPRKRRRRN